MCDVSKYTKVYEDFSEIEGFSAIANIDQIIKNDCKLSISMYVRGTQIESYSEEQLSEAIAQWQVSSDSTASEFERLSQLMEGGTEDEI